MNKEIMGLPKEIENYRNKLMPLYWKVPQKIINLWNRYIEPATLYGSGENGAYAYSKGRRLSEGSLIYFAIHAETKGHPEMANGFWRLAYNKSQSPGEPLATKKKKANSNKVQHAERKIAKEPLSLRTWLFTLIRRQGNYSCYAIFLVLPSDREAIRYLEELSTELKIISNETNSLVVALGSDQHLRSDVDGERWSSTIKGDIQKGYSARIGRLFGLDFTQFPCLVIFGNLNSSEQILITLKDMKAEEIAEKMRSIFSIIQKAVNEHNSPLEALQRNQNNQRLKKAGKSLVIGIRYIADVTFKAVIEALATAQVNKQYTL
jgi:hypothetical protein